jgi:dolichyl-phosphate-mannose--protein O-mannosyl transferase
VKDWICLFGIVFVTVLACKYVGLGVGVVVAIGAINIWDPTY